MLSRTRVGPEQQGISYKWRLRACVTNRPAPWRPPLSFSQNCFQFINREIRTKHHCSENWRCIRLNYDMLSLLLASTLVVQDADGELDRLIRQLGSDDLDEREAATAAIIRKGRAARPDVVRALSHSDKEIASRAAYVLKAIDSHFDSLFDELERVRVRNGDSINKCLREATLSVQSACKGMLWPEVRDSLERQKIRVLDSRHISMGNLWIRYRLAVRSDIVELPTPYRIHLELVIDTRLRISKTEPTKEIVDDAGACFVTYPGVELSTVIRERPFPVNSIFARALQSVGSSSKYPLLDSIEITYGPILDRHSPVVPSGFHVTVRHRNADDSAGSYQCLTAESGLDPVKGKDDQGHVSKDTIQGFRSWGGGSWSSSAKGEGRTYWRLSRIKESETARREAAVVYSIADMKALPPETAAVVIHGEEVEDADLAALAHLKRLETLSLGPCMKGVGVSRLKSIVSLTFTSLSNEGVRELPELPKLTELKSSNSDWLESDDYVALGKLQSLRKLHLGWCNALTDEDLSQLAALAQLQELGLWGSEKISDEGLRHISNLAGLRSLVFSHSPRITCAGTRHLKNLSHLEDLAIGYASVDDAAICEIAGVSSLKTISLRGLPVTDAGLLQLKGLRNLEVLKLDGCKSVTESGVRALLKELPNDFRIE